MSPFLDSPSISLKKPIEIYDEFGGEVDVLTTNSEIVVQCYCTGCSKEEKIRFVTPNDTTIASADFEDAEFRLKVFSETPLGRYWCQLESDESVRKEAFYLSYKPGRQNLS